MDTDKIYGEKVWWELHKNATSYFEQILEATPHKTAAVLLLTSHLKNDLMVDLQFWSYEECIAITLSSTLIQSSSTC